MRHSITIAIALLAVSMTAAQAQGAASAPAMGGMRGMNMRVMLMPTISKIIPII